MATSSSRAAFTYWRFPIFILAISFALAAFGEAGREMFRYQNTALVAGEYWRLLTGHCVHLGWGHYVLNGAGLLAVWALFGAQFSARVWTALFLLSCLGISAGFLLFDTGMAYYVGLSGVLHGLLCAACLSAILQKPSWADAVVFTGLWGKILYEQTTGSVSLTTALSGGPVIVNAHFYGAVIGLVFAGLYACLAQRRKLV